MNTPSVIECVEGFNATQLGNTRKIFVYLPPGYREHVEHRYPVLYMHAGQRAFGSSVAGNETWNVDQAADQLIAQGLMDGLIIVGIAHVRPVTHNEFYHFVAPAREAVSVGCSGLDYEHFILHELKPFIDEHYRTLPDKDNTGLLGSSAAALSTFHIGTRHPDIFGKLIMLSPFFVDVQLDEMSESRLREENMVLIPESRAPIQMWMDIGDAEGLFLPSQVRNRVHQMFALGYKPGKDIAFLEQPGAGHQEADWGERVHLPLLYMFGRIGNPVSLELRGRDVIGVKGKMSCHINALLHYDSGFTMSVLEGEYRSDHPDILEVRPSGELVPVGTGNAVVTLTVGKLSASQMYTVVEELSGHVRVCMSVEAPPQDMYDNSIYGGMGMKLLHTGGGRYEGCFEVPRDSGFRFRFTRGFRQFETDMDGAALPNRVFRANDDLSLHYQIQSWGSTAAKAGNRR
ncbi:alpha/beta hydrolase [Paenibacillus sp. QZ-Y1]|uniref:alpha/beta hydrolase n=1 Tax=Paenibacillus sp. QZ-Y1 TaxID=3414511 RepID=UPI003F78B70D